MPLSIGLGLGLSHGQGGSSLFTPVDLGSAAIGWWDFRTSTDLILGGGNEISAAASKIGTTDMTQASGSLQPVWDANGYAVFDASNDYLEFTLSSGVTSGQMYIQTRFGWYKSGVGNWANVTYKYNGADVQQVVFVDADVITPGQEIQLETYLGETEYYFITKTVDLTIFNRIINSPSVNYTLDYIGANANTYSLASSQSGQTVDISAQSLSAPAHMLWESGIEDDTTITQLFCNTNSLSGAIPTLPSSLDRLYCYDNQLSGAIPALPSSLSILFCYDNQLSGAIPALPSSLDDLRCNNNNLSGAIPALPSSLSFLRCYTNNLSGAIPALPSSLSYLHCYNNQLSGAIPALPSSLSFLYCHNNQLSGYSGGGVGSSLLTFLAQNNQLSESAVDEILSDLDNAGAAGGTVNVGGTGNSAPSAAGSSSAANLSGNGWTVTTN